MVRFRLITCLVVAAGLSACGGGGSGGGGGFVQPSCTVTDQKTFVRDVTDAWYLFPDLLPTQVDISQFQTPQDLLDYMTATARAQGKDRYFSYVTTKQADTSFLQEGQFIGFGFRMRINPDNTVYFIDVFENSPAGDAGIVRGDQLLAIDSGSGYVPVADLLPSDPGLSTALGPATEGVVRGLRFDHAGTVTEASLTKRVVNIPPVPADGVAVLSLPSNPSVKVGYINLRSFISTAETPLRDAFQQFRDAGIQYFIFDERYNGGGLISVSELIGDLFGESRQPGDVFAHIHYRPDKSSQDSTAYFTPQSQSVAPVRIAFITTGATASASEMTINAMKPWADVAIVGANTYGKPVGQSAFDPGGQCDLRLRLITFRVTNADEQGDYYDGLASSLPACAASDDLTHATSDPAESSTAEALHWIATGACTSPIAGVGVPSKPGFARQVRYPLPPRPTPAQSYLPGLY